MLTAHGVRADRTGTIGVERRSAVAAAFNLQVQRDLAIKNVRSISPPLTARGSAGSPTDDAVSLKFDAPSYDVNCEPGLGHFQSTWAKRAGR